MVNKKYTSSDRGTYIGAIGVVEALGWTDDDCDGQARCYRVDDGHGGGLFFYDYELDVLHVPVEVGDIVMFESNPVPFTHLVGTVGQVTWVGTTGCSVKVGKDDFVGSLTRRLTVVG
jgi:hypothetical protein